VVRAAAETGLPVVPLSAAASRGRRLASWDRFLVPGAFARVVVGRGEPLRVPAAVGEAWRGEELRDPATVRGWTDRIRRALERERERCEGSLERAVT